jgi:hypothetical protein
MYTYEQLELHWLVILEQMWLLEAEVVGQLQQQTAARRRKGQKQSSSFAEYTTCINIRKEISGA